MKKIKTLMFELKEKKNVQKDFEYEPQKQGSECHPK